MFNENYLVSVRNPKVKIDNVLVSNIKECDNEDYEFLFEITTDYKKLEKKETREILSTTYNIGKLVEEKFTFDDYLINPNDTHDFKLIRQNLFLKIRNDTNIEYNGSLLRINKEIEKEYDIKMPRDKYDINKVNIFNQRHRNKEKEIYRRRINEEFERHNIKEEDYKDLIKLIKHFVKLCGVPPLNTEITKYEQSLFSILFLSHNVYLFMNNKGNKKIEAKHTQTLKVERNKKRYNMEFDTINDLIYSLAINYILFDGYSYIFCCVCGRMAPGKKGKNTCGEVCKKKRNGHYNEKK